MYSIIYEMTVACFSFDFFATLSGFVVKSSIVSFLGLALTDAGPGAASNTHDEYNASCANQNDIARRQGFVVTLQVQNRDLSIAVVHLNHKSTEEGLA